MNNEQMLSKLKAVRNQLGPDNLSCWDEDDDDYEAAKSLDEIIVSIEQALASEGQAAQYEFIGHAYYQKGKLTLLSGHEARMDQFAIFRETAQAKEAGL